MTVDTPAFKLEDTDIASIKKLQTAYKDLKHQLGRVIVGQDEVIEQLLIAMFSRGHCMLEGVPGLAKTLLISSLAKCLSLDFSRIQFTPDLMPADITGTDFIEKNPITGGIDLKFRPGPLFSNIVLADEINRTPPRTQAALLEAMQERTVTVGRVRHKLASPFFVLATQNPIEQEGTYPLPEAQLDRFLFLIKVDYPSDAEEELIMRSGTADKPAAVSPVLNAEDIVALQQVVRRVPVSDDVFAFAKRITRASRPGTPEAPKFITDSLTWGAGPRASMNLILAAKAHAVLHSNNHVSPDDVRAVALPILRHRLILNFAAQSEGLTIEEVVSRLVKGAAASRAAA